MSDNEDLLADDLGDHSLADYNLGIEEEDQLLADDYEATISQNASSSISSGSESVAVSIPNYPAAKAPEPVVYARKPAAKAPEPVVYARKPIVCEVARPEPVCEVPTLVVEVPNLPPTHTYAPYDPKHDIQRSAPVEIPQAGPPNAPLEDDMGGSRERFISERPPGVQRMPQVRDIPDSLDKVVVANSFPPRPRGWQPQYRHRFNNPYRRHNVHPGNFQRTPFPPPRNYHPRPEMHLNHQENRQNHPHMSPNHPEMRNQTGPPEMRPNHLDTQPGPPEMRNHPEMRPGPPEMRPNHPDMRAGPQEMRPGPPEMRSNNPDMRPGPPEMGQNHPEMRPEMHPNHPPGLRPDFRPDHPMNEMRPGMGERPPMYRPNMQMERPPMNIRPQFRPQFPFRPNMDDPNMRPNFNPNVRPNFEPRGMFQYQQRPGFRPFGPPIREVTPNMAHIPQVTIRQQIPMPHPMGPPMPHPMGPVREPEVRMLPVLPPILPPGKKVHINPHFKGNLHNVEGQAKDIDDAAERFIAEQRNALARAATRKFQRRSPQRHIENTRIEIENDLIGAPPQPPRVDDDLLRRQEEFINANRAQLTRRMRSPSPSPVRRSPSPRRSPERGRIRMDTNRDKPNDEESEYRRRMREQESLRERVLRAKEVRRRKNAVAHKQGERDRERAEKEREYERDPPKPKPEEPRVESVKPDTTRKSPEKEKEIVVRERSPIRDAEVNSTCENLTPPRVEPQKSPERDLTPPLPMKEKEVITPVKEKEKEKETVYSDDDLDLILDDIDDILSDDDSGRFKEKAKKPDPPKPAPSVDLRAKLPPKPPKQRIIFHEKKERERKREKSPPRRTQVSSSTKNDDSEIKEKKAKTKDKEERKTKEKSRQRIMFESREKTPEKPKSPPPKVQKEEEKPQQFSNRRVILQRKVTAQPKVVAAKEKSVFARIEVTSDPTKPHPGIFSRAVRTAIGTEKSTRLVVKKQSPEPEIEYESSSSTEEDKLLEDNGLIAMVANLPHGITDTRLKTLAGEYVQSMTLDKSDRSAKITFKTSAAAESFKKKFNNKMVAASRVTVVLR